MTTEKGSLTINVGFVIRILLGGLSILIFIFATLYFIVERPTARLAHNSKPEPISRKDLEFESGALLREERVLVEKELQTYRWVDSRHESAEVPIERAIEEVSRRNER